MCDEKKSRPESLWLETAVKAVDRPHWKRAMLLRCPICGDGLYEDGHNVYVSHVKAVIVDCRRVSNDKDQGQSEAASPASACSDK